MSGLQDASLVETLEHRRFVEFCEATKESTYIGLCFGPPGVGKTRSARHYSNWDFQDEYLKHGMQKFLAPAEVREYDTLFFTPPVVHTARDLRNGLSGLRKWLSIFIIHSYQPEELEGVTLKDDSTRLIIVDEADRLATQGFEYIRSIYDDDHIAVIFMGMPGIEKRLARYPQLYSRIGFVHEFRNLSPEEIQFVIDSKLEHFESEVILEPEARAAIVRITHGNFRLLLRMLMQIKRLMKINKLSAISKELVEAAREILIIGVS